MSGWSSRRITSAEMPEERTEFEAQVLRDRGLDVDSPAENKSDIGTLGVSIARIGDSEGGAPYLGDMDQIVAILQEYAKSVMDRHILVMDLELGADTAQEKNVERACELAGIFLGEAPKAFVPVEGWNEPGKIDDFAAAQLEIGDDKPADRMAHAILQIVWAVYAALREADAGKPEGEWNSDLDGAINDLARIFLGVPFRERETEEVLGVDDDK